MGWTFYNHTPPCIRSEIKNLCTFESEDRIAAPVKASRVGTTWYVAVKVQLKGALAIPGGHCPFSSFTLDSQGAYVFAAVFLTRSEGGAWGFKDMDECMGPGMSEAPLAILDLLSPTSSEYALKWRERCRAIAALKSRTIENGDVIKLETPLEFADGRERSLFRVDRSTPPGYRRAVTAFVCLETGARCRISGVMQRLWRKLSDDEARSASAASEGGA